MFQFHKRYFFLAILLFIVEVFIAVYVHDKIIRPYIGDYLVVIFIYCFLRSFLNISVYKLAVSVLLFSYAVEILQYFNFANHVGLKNSKLAHIILGSSFEWTDLLVYTLGILTVLIIEAVAHNK